VPRAVQSASALSGAKRTPGGRFIAAALSAAIHLAVLAALLLWHFSPSPPVASSALSVVELPAPQPPEEKKPPPPPEPHKTGGKAKSEAAAPPAPKAASAPLAAAIVPLVAPSFAPPPTPSTGNQQSSGNALAGTGSGAGGTGNGTGRGGAGEGGSGGTREGTAPEVVRGDFKPSDYPKALREAGPRGRTWTEVMVAPNGRPVSCQVTRTSGTGLLDTETCRIIMQRFRFRPGRDAAGRAVLAPFYIDIAWEYVDLTKD
jgi:protein TonB